MLSANLILLGICVLAVFGIIDGLLNKLRIRRPAFVFLSLCVIILSFVPAVSVFGVFTLNIGGFAAAYGLGFAFLIKQRSWKEAIRVFIAVSVSTILLAAYDSPKLLLSSIAFFRFNYYLKLLLITLPAIIITQRPGAAVAGAIFSVCAYDMYSGFAEVMHNSTPFLGSDYFYSLTVYSFIVVVFLSLIIYPLRRKKRKPVLTFNSQSANSLLINKNVK